MTDGRIPLGSWLGEDYEVVAEIWDNMPTGITVTDDGRIFLSFPRWGDDVPFTVGELVNGKVVPYPDAESNEWHDGDSPDRLISVQSVIVDPVGHLWLLDTGAPEFNPYVPNGPKLIEIDPQTNKTLRTIRPSAAALTPMSYLNDVRFDLSAGEDGVAYLSDSQAVGAIIVIDLSTGETRSRLRGHETTRAADQFRAIVQGTVREGYKVGTDGIALSPEGDRLYYCSLSGRRLYSVSTAALTDPNQDDDDVAATVLDLGDKGASDGLECDTDGAVYATAYEHSAVIKRSADGAWSTIVHGPLLLWPDTLSLAGDGYLYVTINQLPRIPLFNSGVDDRVKPYLIIRKQVGAKPVRLRRR